MKKNLRYYLLAGGAALAFAVVSTLAPDLILSGGNATVAQSGTAEDYFDVTCSAPVKSVLILGSYVRLHDCTVVGSTSHSIRVGNQYGNPNAALAHHVLADNVTALIMFEIGTLPQRQMYAVLGFAIVRQFKRVKNVITETKQQFSAPPFTASNVEAKEPK